MTPKPNTKSPGRPRSFKVDEALDAAIQVFWQKGYEGASLQDLTAAMGLRPASLYATFGNKEALFFKALERYLAGPVAFIRKALGEPTAYAVAERTLVWSAEFLTQPNTPLGCMTIQTALAAAEEAARVHRKLVDLRVRAQEALRERFERAQREGDLSAGENADDLARYVTTLFQGMTVQAINGATREDLMRLVRFALRNWPGAVGDYRSGSR